MRCKICNVTYVSLGLESIKLNLLKVPSNSHLIPVISQTCQPCDIRDNTNNGISILELSVIRFPHKGWDRCGLFFCILRVMAYLVNKTSKAKNKKNHAWNYSKVKRQKGKGVHNTTVVSFENIVIFI